MLKDQPKILLIETSTERGIVTILDGTIPLFHKDLPFGYQNSSHLLPLMQEAFQQLHITPKEIALIGVGIGPGSYTGIRIGAITAKTLAYACQRPLVGICSLKGFIPDSDGSFAVLIDAKIGGAYMILGHMSKGVVTYLTEPAVYPLEKLGVLLEDSKTIVTPCMQRLKPALIAMYPQHTWQWQEVAPNAVHMAKIVLEKFHAGEVVKDNKLELLYLRKTQAEIERGK